MAMTAFRPRVATGPALLLALLLIPMAQGWGLAQLSGSSRLVIATADGQETRTFAVTVKPGETAGFEFRLGAEADAPVDVVTWVANVVSPINGGTSLTPENVPAAGPAAWVDFPAGPLTLEPGAPVARTARIVVPGGARPGLYVAAIVVQAPAPAPVAGVDGASQVPRASAIVAITVPGALEPEFAAGEPTLVQRGQGGVIQVPVTNTGTVPVFPQGTLTLADAAGDDVIAIEVRMGAVHAGGEALLEVPLEPLPAAGEYRLTLELGDPDTGVSDRIEDRVLLVPEGPGQVPDATADVLVPPALPETPVATASDQPARAEIRFEDATVRADRAPVLSVFVEAHISNTGAPVGSARLTLAVTYNGRVVEEAVLADRVSLVTGITSFSTRYAPEEGFAPGIWTFALVLEAIDEEGNASTLANSGTVAKLDIS